jgi:hypothetical protein
MVECVNSPVQPDAPFGGIAHALILESRALGWREHPTEYAAMCLDELTAIRSLLTSDDLALKKVGIEAARAVRKGQRDLVKLELEYAKVGIEARTYDRLSRLRFASESNAQGLSSENVSAGMAAMMTELMEQRKGNARSET